MVALFVKRFDGQVPSVAPRLLDPTSATAVVNANLLDGTLRGIHAPQLLREMDKGAIVYQSSFKIPRDGAAPDLWCDFPHPFTDFLKGPLVNDQFERYYVSAPGQPPRYNSVARIAAGHGWLRLGVPKPTIPLSVSIVQDADQSRITVTRGYTYTLLTEFNEEGPPADPITLAGKPNDQWVITVPTPPSDPERSYNKKRIYRTVLDSTGTTQFWLVAELPWAQTVYTDTRTDLDVAATGTALQSTNWFPPPDNLDGLIAMPDGFLVGFAGRDVYFSEKFRPHAWPTNYVLSVEHPIVGLGVFGQTCIVCTKAYPVALSGVSPSNITMTKTTVSEPCLSRGSIVSTPEGVYYASHNGLVLAASDGVTNITQQFIAKDYWKTRYKPEMLRAARYKTMYIGINEEGRGFILNLGNPRVALSEFNSLMSGQNMVNDPWTGEVLLIGRNNVYVWDPEYSTPVAALWRSKEFVLEKPVNFGVIDIHIGETLSPGYPVLLGSFETQQPVLVGQDNGPPIEVPAIVEPPAPDAPRPRDLTPSSPMGVPTYTEQVRLDEDKAMRIRIWASRQLVFDEQIDSSQTTRLPSGFKSDTWQFEVISRVPVMSVAMAETLKELRNV